MLTQDEVLKLRKQVGVPDGGMASVAQNQTAEDRIAGLRSTTQQGSGGISMPSILGSMYGIDPNIGIGVIKGVVSGVRAAGVAGQEIAQQTIGRGIEKITGTPKEELGSPLYEGKEPEALEAKNIPQGIGKFGIDVATYFVPETFIAKTLTKVPSLIRGGIQVAKDVAITQAKEGEDAGTTGVISAGVRSIVPGVRLLGGIFQRGLGFIAARGTDLVDEVIKNPEYARLGLAGDPVQILKESATKLSNYAKEIKTAASATFREGLDAVEKQYTKVLKGFKVVKPKEVGGIETIVLRDGTTIIKDPQGNKFNLSLESIKGAVTKVLNEFNVSGNTKVGFDPTNSALSTSEFKAVEGAIQKLKNWKDITPTGLNRLADAVKAYAKPEVESFARANAVIFKLASSVDDYLISHVPKFKELNASFSGSQKFLEELSVHLNAIGKSTSAREIQRVSAKIQNLFGANKDTAREFLRGLPGGEEILGKEAGRQLRVADISKASGSIGNVLANFIQTALPPKTIGYIASYFGTSKIMATKIYNTLKPLGEAERVTVINLMKELIDK